MLIRHACVLILAAVLDATVGGASRSYQRRTLRTVEDRHRPADGCQHHDPLYSQIHKDLKPWHENGIRARNAPNYAKLCEPKSLPCYFVTLMVENGSVYLTSFIEDSGVMEDGLVKSTSPGRAGDAYTLSGFLLEVYEASLQGDLPNGEFSLYWGDDHGRLSGLYALQRAYEEAPNQFNDTMYPIMLTFSKAAPEPYVLMPFSSHQRCSVDNIDHLMASRASMPNTTWAERTAKAFGCWSVFCAYWQDAAKWPDGKRMGCARQDLIPLGKDHPDMLDVASIDTGSRPFTDHFTYKYAVSTDGWTASSRLEKVMLTGAAVLKQTSPRYAYFYSQLREFEHYVPFWRDNTSDILQAVQWLREHDEEAQRIAQNAHIFVRKHLARPARVCYWRHLMRGIGRLTRYTPTPCTQRKVCAPLGPQLSFMGHYLGCSPYSSIHQQLDEMHGRPLNHGNKTDVQWGQPSGLQSSKPS